jgi:ACR3 family arsenite efflux pump ArsB
LSGPFAHLIVFRVSFWVLWALNFNGPWTATLAFTAASNNLELTIAATVNILGIDLDVALAPVTRPFFSFNK